MNPEIDLTRYKELVTNPARDENDDFHESLELAKGHEQHGELRAKILSHHMDNVNSWFRACRKVYEEWKDNLWLGPAIEWSYQL